MQKKKALQKKQQTVFSHKVHSSLHQPKTTEPQSFWFRLWIGFMIGANAAFAVMTLLVLANASLRILLPTYQGVLFILMGTLDIWYMIRLLRWETTGLYGTLAITLVSMILNMYWGADVFTSILYGLVPAAITLAFVIPKWSRYQ